MRAFCRANQARHAAAKRMDRRITLSRDFASPITATSRARRSINEQLRCSLFLATTTGWPGSAAAPAQAFPILSGRPPVSAGASLCNPTTSDCHGSSIPTARDNGTQKVMGHCVPGTCRDTPFPLIKSRQGSGSDAREHRHQLVLHALEHPLPRPGERHSEMVPSFSAGSVPRYSSVAWRLWCPCHSEILRMSPVASRMFGAQACLLS